MTTSGALQLAMLVVAALLVIMSLATSVQRFARTRATAKQEQREAAVRPRLMRLLSEDEPDLTPLNSSTAREVAVLETLAWQLLPKVRGSSRTALVSWLESRGAVERARLQTRSRSVIRRATAAEQLGSAGAASTVPDVTRLLSDKNGEVRIVAARALGKLGDPSVVPALLNSLVGPRALPVSIVAMALIHVGPAAIDDLVAALGSRESAIRSVAAELLGMHGAIKAEQWLLLMVDHETDLAVRTRAIGALGRIGSQHSTEALSRATSGELPREVRISAARSLGLIGGTQAVKALHALLESEDDEVGQVAGESLASCGKAGEEVLATVARGHGVGAERARDWMARLQLIQRSRRSRRSYSRNVINHA